MTSTTRITRRQFVRDTATMVAGTALAATSLGSQLQSVIAAGKRPPNILLLYSDQHNARILGCAGHPDVKTPHLDQRFKFKRAYVKTVN